MNIQDNVKTLLENKPELRDHSGELACQYKYTYLRGLDYETFVYEKYESKITRVSARLQRQFPELRGKEWGKRQAHSRVVAQKMRSQEKPELI